MMSETCDSEHTIEHVYRAGSAAGFVAYPFSLYPRVQHSDGTTESATIASQVIYSDYQDDDGADQEEAPVGVSDDDMIELFERISGYWQLENGRYIASSDSSSQSSAIPNPPLPAMTVDSKLVSLHRSRAKRLPS
jgi:hypothetical protein